MWSLPDALESAVRACDTRRVLRRRGPLWHRRSCCPASYSAGRAAASPNTSTGPAPWPRPRNPLRTASAAIDLALRDASSGSKPRARWAASADEWVQPDPCPAPPGWRSPGISTSRSPSRKRSAAGLPVTARDHNRARAARQDRASEQLGLVLAGASGAPASPPARRPARAPPARFGVTTATRGAGACAGPPRRPRRAAARRSRRPSRGRARWERRRRDRVRGPPRRSSPRCRACRS